MANQHKVPKTIHILLADDDEDDYILLKHDLEQCCTNFDLHWAQDGENVLKQLKEGPLPDLLLLDMNMPRTSGQELLEEIRRNGALKAIPVILLTGNDRSPVSDIPMLKKPLSQNVSAFRLLCESFKLGLFSD
jgi:CheY-like chemotaxis protein